MNCAHRGYKMPLCCLQLVLWEGLGGEIQENVIFLSQASGCRGRSPSELHCQGRAGFVEPRVGQGCAPKHGTSSGCPLLHGPSAPHGKQAGFVLPGCPDSGPGQESCCRWQQLLCRPGNRCKPGSVSSAWCWKVERLGGSSWRGAGMAGSTLVILSG